MQIIFYYGAKSDQDLIGLAQIEKAGFRGASAENLHGRLQQGEQGVVTALLVRDIGFFDPGETCVFACVVAVDSAGEAVADVSLTPAEMRIDVIIQQRPDVSELNVEPRIVGETPAGYVRGNYNWEPKRIIVRGDLDAIAAMNGSAPTEPIDLTGRTESFTQTVHLVLPQGVTLPDPTDITITVEIEPVVVTREFANVAVQSQGLDPADYRILIQPERVNVLVRGPQAIVDGLATEDVSVFAPLNGLTPGTHTVTLTASVADADIRAENVTIPNDQATIIIEPVQPTPTPGSGPLRTPTRAPRR